MEEPEAGMERSDVAEPREATERMPFEQELHDASEGIRANVEAGVPFERATEELAGQLRDAIIDRLDLGRELVGGLSELVERGCGELTERVRNLADQLLEGLESLAGLLARGADWLRQNGEVFEAAVKVLVLAALAGFEPSVFGKLVTEDPRRVSGPLATLAGALGGARA